MFRYIALAWNPSDACQIDACEIMTRQLIHLDMDFRVVFDFNGLKVLCADAGSPGLTAQVLKNRSGVLLGSAFRRNSDINDDQAVSVATLSDAETQQIISSQGRALVSGYWGNYVAFLLNATSNTKRVIKDPTGNLPCFATSWQKVAVVFSCLGDCVQMGFLPFTVNWSYVASRVGSGGFGHLCSPLNEVTEIERGHCLEIGDGRIGRQVAKLYSNPGHFSSTELSIDEPKAASRALSAAVRMAVLSLAGCHERVLMRLSGGLDSSIVSGVLKRAKANLKVASYTYFIRRGRSDERRWASLAAEHAGSRHFEYEIDPNLRLELLTRTQPSVSPVWAFAYLGAADFERQLLESHPYTGLFTGDGGDSVFGKGCIRFAVDDYIRLRGLSRGLVKLAAQVGLATDSLTWSVLGSALRRAWFGSFMRDYRDKLLVGSSLASPNVRGMGLDSARYPHPWFAACKRVPWHVITRLGNLLDSPQLYNPFLAPCARSPYIISPLYSQPVIEICLRIPAHVHFYDGTERGLARKAFEQDVPAAILRRQWKDCAPGAFEEMVLRNRSFISEMLEGGVLCDEGLLDRDAIRDALSGKLSTRKFYVGELMNYLHVEIWLRHFVGRSKQRLAA
jgi:asparagine synthase (glutamine-hydrolysing)